MLAPASNASCVLSICSSTDMGMAGFAALVGTDPVIATQIIHGLLDIKKHRFVFTLEDDIELICVLTRFFSKQGVTTMKLFD